MRDLKFRAWHRLSRLMMFGENHHIFQWLEEEKQPIELMQYTGLKDSKGCEIYEGDIVTIESYNTFLGAWQIEYRLPVKYLGDKFCATDGRAVESLNFLPEHITVIGNIWEHKDLLNG